MPEHTTGLHAKGMSVSEARHVHSLLPPTVPLSPFPFSLPLSLPPRSLPPFQECSDHTTASKPTRVRPLPPPLIIVRMSSAFLQSFCEAWPLHSLLPPFFPSSLAPSRALALPHRPGRRQQ
jgi:hypothetical protein